MIKFFPRVGMRMVKTAIAVFLSLMLSLFIPDSIPVNAAVTAILCMQPYLSEAKSMGLNRIVGACIGGVFGMFALMIIDYFNFTLLLRYFFVSVGIIVMIQITLYIKKPMAAVFTCIVFMSTTLMSTQTVMPAYWIALHRVVDTLLGIVVSMAVNSFHLPVGTNKSILFVSELDGALCNTSGNITTHSALHLNRMIDDGLWFTIVTNRTPGTFYDKFDGVNINLPVIAMEGAILYDVKDQSYASATPMERDLSDEVEAIFAACNRNCFVHSIMNETMHIYYGIMKNTQEERFYHRYRKTNFKNYIFGSMPEDQQAVCILAIDEEVILTEIKERIEIMDKKQALRLQIKPYGTVLGYSMLEVYSAEASRERAVEKLAADLSLKNTVVYGVSNECLPLFDDASLSVALENASPKLKLHANRTIGDNDSDALIRSMEKIFYRRLFRKNSLTDRG